MLRWHHKGRARPSVPNEGRTGQDTVERPYDLLVQNILHR